MLCVDHYHGPLRFQFFHDNISKLGSQTLLDGRSLGKDLKRLGKLADACDLACAGNIGNMSLADERQKMVLTYGIKGDIFQQDEFFVAFTLDMLQDLFCRGLKAGKYVLIHPGYPAGRALHPGPLRIFTNALDDEPDPFFDLLDIHRISLIYPEKSSLILARYKREVKRLAYKYILFTYGLLLVLIRPAMISYCMYAGFFQFNTAFGRKRENLEKVRAATRDTSLDLFVLPEFFATGYQFVSPDEVAELAEAIPGGETTEFLISLSQERGFYIVAGLPERSGDTFYNSAVLTGPEGFIGSYRKTHLFFEENVFFMPGDSGFRVWDTKIGRIGVMICFDWFFPEAARTLALKGAEVIAHPSNLVLPYCPQSMPVRCLENRVYAITANRTGTEQRKEGAALTFIGQSQITSPKGEILVRAGNDEGVLLSADIDLSFSRDKQLNQYNDLFKDRKPALYDS